MTKKQIEDNIESCLDLIIILKMDHKFLIQLATNIKQDFKNYKEGEYEQDY